MIDNFADILDKFIVGITFLSHFIICYCVGYSVMHSDSMAKWQKTSLWYIALSSFFIVLTIIIQWVFGNKFPLSYDQIGILGEVFFVAAMTSCAIVMFRNVILRKVKEKNDEEEEAAIAAKKPRLVKKSPPPPTGRHLPMSKRPPPTDRHAPVSRKPKKAANEF